jgi:nitroreductase
VDNGCRQELKLRECHDIRCLGVILGRCAAPLYLVASARSRMAELFADNAVLAEATAFRSGTLQGGYLVLAARALGLSVGPMSGFDTEKLNREFFPDGRYRANFLANIGYAEQVEARPRGARFEFADVAQVI